MLFIIYVSIIFGSTLTTANNVSDKLESPFSSHCFKRLSVGERLIALDVTRIIERNAVDGCEEECNIYKCTHFSFGVLPGGNGTCELSTGREISRRLDPNFDLYQKTKECVQGKPTGYEKACYRRIISGKRLHERFIRHSLPCNSLEACQHQCSIEKHFDCQGFNIRLDPVGVGRGVCELSSMSSSFLDFSKDFVFDPEFTYYERDRENDSPNCGYSNLYPNGPPGIYRHLDSAGGQQTTAFGGPYYGGDSYGPWSTGHGTVDHGPWGSHGYGSGYYQSNNPSTGPLPTLRPSIHLSRDPYVYGRPYSGYPFEESKYDRQNRIPTYIIIDADAKGGNKGNSNWIPNKHLSEGGGRGDVNKGDNGIPKIEEPTRSPFSGGPYGRPNAGGPLGGPFGGPYGRPNTEGPLGGPFGGPYGRPNVEGPLGGPYGRPNGLGPLGGPYGRPNAEGPLGGPYGRPNGGGPLGGPYGRPNAEGPLGGPYGRPNGGGPLGGPYGRSNAGEPLGGPYGRPNAGGLLGSPYGRPIAEGPLGGPYGRLNTGKPLGESSSGVSYGGTNSLGRPNGPRPYEVHYGNVDRRINGDLNGGGLYADSSWSSYGSPKQIYGPGIKYLPAVPNTSVLPSRLPQIPRLPPLSPQPQFPYPPSSPPKLYDNFPPGSLDNSLKSSHNSVGHKVCFRREHPGYKLDPSTIRQMYDTPTILDCETMCQKSIKCTGYSFRYSSGTEGPNCLLTDFGTLNRDTHLLPDRSCDVYFKMTACLGLDKVGDAECFLKVATNRKLDPSKVVQKVIVGGMSECELACLTSKFFTCRSFSFRYGPGVIGEPLENCLLTDWPTSALTHQDFVPITGHEVFERGSYGHGCELEFDHPNLGPRPPLLPHPNFPRITHSTGIWSVDDTWKHFTVNGWPCRVGTECRLNPEAGFWGCEVEGGDKAQWDYCCRPKHSCGFSRGYNYPWCYVGEAGPDQWRPCSEHYYPDFRNRHPNKPVQGLNLHPADSYAPIRNSRPWNFGEEEYGPPSYWPISYLYTDPPPNETKYWDLEEYEGHNFHHHHHHHHYYQNHHEDHPPHQQYYEHIEDSPTIKFKNCGHKAPYPRAIIQKLDLKNTPKAEDPGEQLKNDEKPARHPKKVAPDNDTEKVFGFSSNIKNNNRLKDAAEFFPSATPAFENHTEVKSDKKQLSKGPDSNKTKEVIKTVEKLIEKNTEKNESLAKLESKYPSFLTLTQLEKFYFRNGWN